MKMKSIRIDFPAEGISINDRDIPALIAAALMAGKDKASTAGGQVLHAAAVACSKASYVEEYDDRFGGPVFYIP